MAKAAGTSGPSSSQKASSSIWPTILLVTAVFGAMLSFLVFNNPFKLDFNLTEKQPEKTDYPGRARSVLRSTPLIDGHNDFPFLLRLDLKNQIYGTDFEKLHSQSQTDLFKMREGMMGGQFWSVWVPCPGQLDPGMEKHDMNFSNPLGDGTKKVPGLHDPNWSVRDTLEQIDLTKRFVAQYPNHLQLCTEPLCVRSAHKAGKVASMIGIEGGHQTGNSLGALRLMFDMGARYVTITHNCDNAYATAWSSVDKTKTGRDADPGLTDFGRELVQEMNRLGMLVDISHVSPNAMRDVLDVAQAPVIFSHSGAYGVHPMGRNVPDDVLRRLKKNGGVVMVPTISFFLRDKNPEEATVEDVVDHIMHIAEVAGWEHVGIGSDFDGSTVVAKGIEDTTQYPNLVARVLARGATDEQAKLLVGDNVLRAWTEAEKVAKKLQGKGELPNEAYYEGRLWEPDIGDIVPHVLPQNN